MSMLQWWDPLEVLAIVLNFSIISILLIIYPIPVLTLCKRVSCSEEFLAHVELTSVCAKRKWGQKSSKGIKYSQMWAMSPLHYKSQGMDKVTAHPPVIIACDAWRGNEQFGFRILKAIYNWPLATYCKASKKGFSFLFLSFSKWKKVKKEGKGGRWW